MNMIAPNASANLLLAGVIAPAALAIFGGLLSVGLVRARRRTAAPGAERAARAEMDALCPNGWEAQITLYGSSPTDSEGERSGDGASPQVLLEWTELSDRPVGRQKIAVVRRLWATDIAAALEDMVEDRRTDLTLESIEREATAAAANFPQPSAFAAADAIRRQDDR
jgi:hypothetical protein